MSNWQCQLSYLMNEMKLNWIILLGFDRIAKMLVNSGADIKIKNNEGDTARDIAVYKTSMYFVSNRKRAWYLEDIIIIDYNQIDFLINELNFLEGYPAIVDIIDTPVRKISKSKINSKHVMTI